MIFFLDWALTLRLLHPFLERQREKSPVVRKRDRRTLLYRIFWQRYLYPPPLTTDRFTTSETLSASIFPTNGDKIHTKKAKKNKPCLTEKCGERGPVFEGPQPVLAFHEGLAEGPGAGPVAPVDGVDAIPVGGRRLAGQLAVWKCRKRGSSEFRGRFCVRIWFDSVAELVTVNDRRRNRTAEQKV